MYRPEGWINPNQNHSASLAGAYEAGADAMLEALFKAAKESPTKTFIIDSRISNVYAGIFPFKE